MIELRPKASLAGGDLGWLKALHHFDIGGGRGNPAHQALGNLFVWNDDELAPGTGFPAHGHADVEIITYVREGFVLHKDSLDNEGRTDAGDVQVMSAGTGMTHAETGSPDSPTKVFQIWIRPRQKGGEPRWGTKPFPKADRAGRFVILASGFEGDTEALLIRADARVLGATLSAGQTLTYVLGQSRKAYIVPTTGSIQVNHQRVDARDGAAIWGENEIRIEALADTEIVFVDAV